MNLAPIIKEFLLHNEKLVIPGFGALITFYHPAEINKTSNTLIPPSKEIRFDVRQKYDDNQLAEIIMNKHNLDETKAMEIINNFVHTLEEQINKQGFALIEDVGSINKEPSGYLTFKPHSEFANLTGTFGLTKLNVPASASFNAQREITRIPVSRSTEVKPKKRKWWIPAAIFLLLISLSSLVYFTGLFNGFVTVDNKKKNDINGKENPDRIVFGNRVSAEKDTLQEMIRRQLEERTLREKALSYQESDNKPAESKPSEVVSQRPVPAPVIGGPYHIIAGSFLVPGNAERQKLKLERSGFSPVLLPPKGNYIMVSLGSYKSREQAIAAMKSLREKAKIELWVMRE